jgi:Cu(I)/Ag(I) efflux system membrane fusion protein
MSDAPTTHEAPHDMPEGEEPPPPGTRVMAGVRWAILAGVVLLAAGSWWAYLAPRHEATAPVVAAKYQCPMHPQVVSDLPGDCPICHMALVPIETDAGAAGAAAIVSPDPDAGPSSMPPGTTAVSVPQERAQAIGVRTALAAERATSGGLRVTASIAAADQSVAEVHVRSAGFVERIPVDQVGLSVAKGQELLAVYSPEVFQAEMELITARQWADGGARTLDAARAKLDLLGVDARDIERIVASGTPIRAVPVYAPEAGIVTKKTALRGAYVTPEMPLFTIEDRSRVYVVADVFAQDVASIKVGTPGKFTLWQRPDVSLSAKVDLIYPSVDPESRTTRVRMTVPNAKGALRPGDYGDVELAGTTPGRELVVPRDAVIDTGETKYVFLVDSPGQFTPRTVDVGPEQGGDIVIRSGLAAGDRVVSGATFLIDSESRLQASLNPTVTASIDGGAAKPSGGPCDADFDRARYPDKYTECTKCSVHRGMGSMEADCIAAIPKPWK